MTALEAAGCPQGVTAELSTSANAVTAIRLMVVPIAAHVRSPRRNVGADCTAAAFNARETVRLAPVVEPKVLVSTRQNFEPPALYFI